MEPESKQQIENEPTEEAPDEEIREIMASHDLDEETAERVCEAMDECGVDEDDAIEIVDEGL